MRPWEVTSSAPTTLANETHGSSGRQDGAATRRAARRISRKRILRRRRRLVVLAMMAVTVVLVGVDFARGGSARIDPNTRVANPADGAELAPPASAAPAAGLPSSTPTVSPSPSPSVPQRGTGRFVIAAGEMSKIGRGKLMTYSVEAEDGSGVTAARFASEVDNTLSDSKSWTANGEWAFRRVSSGSVDFVVRLATPDTVDKICGAAGLRTGGYVSCRTGPFVMINLARWELAVPDYKGDVPLYRRYVINHEVGHRLGHGHELCPGPGKVAPIMQQQTYGLGGCVPNGWPFVGGRLVKGPATTRD